MTHIPSEMPKVTVFSQKSILPQHSPPILVYTSYVKGETSIIRRKASLLSSNSITERKDYENNRGLLFRS